MFTYCNFFFKKGFHIIVFWGGVRCPPYREKEGGRSANQNVPFVLFIGGENDLIGEGNGRGGGGGGN